MRRTILVLMVIVMMVVATALPALGSHRPDSWKLDNDEPEEPKAPRCGWYYYEDRKWDPWWEYWCYWRGWGWEFVFWVWA